MREREHGTTVRGLTPKGFGSAVPLTVRHRYRTPTRQPLDGPASWDAIRQTDSPFRVPLDRSDWFQLADSNPHLTRRAQQIAIIAASLEARVVASYGAGTALMERHLVERVDRLRCTDFSPQTLVQMRSVAPEIEFVDHDLSRSPQLDADLHVLHRVDTELNDATWARLFSQWRPPILIAISELLTLRAIGREIATRMRGGSPAGWLRTDRAMRRLFGAHAVERVEVGDLAGYLLV